MAVLWVTVSSACLCIAEDLPKNKIVLRVDETVVGPYGGQRSASCLRVYSNGRAIYARWWNSAFALVDEKTGQKTKPEHTLSVEHQLEDYEISELTAFADSNKLRRLPEAFDPPHKPIDYIEKNSIELTNSKGKAKRISTREFFVASMEERVRYPSALIVLMDRIDEIERQATDKGKEVAVPPDCQLKPLTP